LFTNEKIVTVTHQKTRRIANCMNTHRPVSREKMPAHIINVQLLMASVGESNKWLT